MFFPLPSSPRSFPPPSAHPSLFLSKEKKTHTKTLSNRKIKTHKPEPIRQRLLKTKPKKKPMKKTHGVHFVLAWGLFWSVVDILGDTALEKMDFPFPSTYQLQITSWLGWD